MPDLMLTLGILHQKLTKQVILFTHDYINKIHNLQYLNMKAILPLTELQKFTTDTTSKYLQQEQDSEIATDIKRKILNEIATVPTMPKDIVKFTKILSGICEGAIVKMKATTATSHLTLKILQNLIEDRVISN